MVALGHIFKEMGASYNQKLARVRAALILVHSDALSKLALSYTAFFDLVLQLTLDMQR